MKRWMVTAAVLALCSAFLAGGCIEDPTGHLRLTADHESAILSPYVQTANGSRVGGRVKWNEAGVAGGESETVEIGGFATVNVDPNTTSGIGLPPITVPFGAKLGLGAFLATDTEYSGVSMGPMATVDRDITERITLSTEFTWGLVDDNLEAAGYRPGFNAYLGTTYNF